MTTQGERLQLITKNLNISRHALSKILGISLSSVTLYYNNDNKIRKVIALAMQACYGINAEWLLNNKRPIFIKKEIKGHKLENDAIATAITYSNLSKKSKQIIQTIIKSLNYFEKQQR